MFERKSSIDEILIKLVMLAPFTMLIQPYIDWSNKVLVGSLLIIVISAFVVKRRLVKSVLILIFGSMYLFLYSLININFDYFNVNMLFYFPLWTLFLHYMAMNIKPIEESIKKSLVYIKFMVVMWCVIVTISIPLKGSYINGMFKSFAQGPFRYAPTALFMSVMIWLLVEGYKNKKWLVLEIVPFVTISMTGSRTYTIVNILILSVIVVMNVKKFRSLFFPGLLILPPSYFFIMNSQFMLKFNNSISNPYVKDRLAAVTSNRSVFWIGEISLFLKADIGEQLFGGGITSSFVKNVLISGQAIWAHNDFLEILNAHGLIGLVFYSIPFFHLFKKIDLNVKSKMIIFIICFLNAFFNGLYVYISATLAIPFLLLACKMSESNKWDYKKRSNNESFD